MNPENDNPNNNPTDNPNDNQIENPTPFSPPQELTTSPEADAAAMQVVEALESEGDTTIGAPSGSLDSPAGSVDGLAPVSSIDNQPEQTPQTEPVTPFNPVETNFPEIASQPVIASAEKKSRKPIIIILVVILVLVGVAAGYFIWQSLQPITPASSNQESSEVIEEGTPTDLPAVDTPESVNDQADTIESSLQDIDDSEFEDSTLSDEALTE